MKEKNWINEWICVLIPIFASSRQPEKYFGNAIDTELMLSFLALLLLIGAKYLFKVNLDYSKPWLTMYWAFWNPIVGLILVVKNRKIKKIYLFISLAIIFVTFYAFYLNMDNDYTSPEITLNKDYLVVNKGEHNQSEIVNQIVDTVSDNKSLLNRHLVEIENFEDIDFKKSNTTTETLRIKDDNDNYGYKDFELTIR